MKRHTMQLTIDEGVLSVAVNCPYDLADKSRPCWAEDIDHPDEDGNYPLLPAPQPCNYVDWAENLAPEELLHDEWSIEVETEWSWGGDEPRVTLLGWTADQPQYEQVGVIDSHEPLERRIHIDGQVPIGTAVFILADQEVSS